MRTGNSGINQAEDEYFIAIGYISKTHGIKGDIKVIPLTDIPDRYNNLKKITVYPKNGQKREYRINRVKNVKGGVVLSFSPPLSISEGEELVGGYIKVPSNEIPSLEQDRYYQFEVTGMEVFTEDGKHIGIIEDIISTGSNDVYVVKDGESEYLIPAVHDVVKKVDIAGKRMTISLLEGLL